MPVMRTLDYTASSEDTMFKVQAAITALGYSGQPVLDLINSMQNAGILFREPIEDGELPQDAITTYGSRIPDTVPRTPIAAYNLGWREGRESVGSKPTPWLDKRPEPTETDPDLMPPFPIAHIEAQSEVIPQSDDDRDPRIPLHVRMQADADEARQEFEDVIDMDKPLSDRDRELYGGAFKNPDTIKVSQAEEPIEQRLIRAHLNGYTEGIQRASWGVPWDHS